MFKTLRKYTMAFAGIAAAISLAAGCAWMGGYNVKNEKETGEYAKETVDYAKDYTDIYGITAEEVADRTGMSFEDFLQYYDLPEDLPKDLNSNATEKNIPAGRIAELNNFSSFDEFRESMGWDESITETTPFGVALDNTQLKYYVGEEYMDMFREEYGFGEEVTADTLYGDVRIRVEEQQKEAYAASQTSEEADKDPEEAKDTEDVEAKDADEDADAPTEAANEDQ